MMKNILLIISIVFLFSASSIAQKITQADFNNLVDYVSCEYANQYIPNYPNKKDAESKAYINSIKPKLDQCTLDNHLSFDVLYELLKNNSWATTANNLSSTWKVKKMFSDVPGKINSEIINYIVKIDEPFKTTIGDNFINDIKNELNQKYPNVIPLTSSVTTINLSSKEKEEIITQAINKFNVTHSHFILWLVVISEAIFIIAFLIIAFLIPLIKPKKNLKGEMQGIKDEMQGIKDEIRNEIKGRNNREYIIQQVLGSNRITNKFKQKSGKLDSQTTTSSYSCDEKTIDTIVDRVLECISLNGKENQSKGKTELTATPETPESPESTLKYLKEREGMLLFKEASKENAYYELFNIQVNKASYRFCGNEDRAMANYDAVLKDVFDDEKSYSSKAKQITNRKEGVVELQEDGSWKIKTPAKIKFI